MGNFISSGPSEEKINLEYFDPGANLIQLGSQETNIPRQLFSSERNIISSKNFKILKSQVSLIQENMGFPLAMGACYASHIC